MKPLTKLITVSPKGLDFDNQSLNEDTLNTGQLVIYMRRLYVTGRVFGNLVDLFTQGNHKRHTTTRCSNLRMVKNKVR